MLARCLALSVAVVGLAVACQPRRPAGGSRRAIVAVAPPPSASASTATSADPSASAAPSAATHDDDAHRAGRLGLLHPSASASAGLLGVLRASPSASASAGWIGGLGLSGVGQGGGGTQGGGIGIGNVNGRRTLRGAPGPKVTAGQTQVGAGPYPKEIVRRVIRQHQGLFRYCYQRGLMKDPKAAGRIVVAFSIGPSGRTRSITSTSPQALAGVAPCIEGAFATMQFPKPKSGLVRVSYPLVFSPR